MHSATACKLDVSLYFAQVYTTAAGLLVLMYVSDSPISHAPSEDGLRVYPVLRRLLRLLQSAPMVPCGLGGHRVL